MNLRILVIIHKYCGSLEFSSKNWVNAVKFGGVVYKSLSFIIL